MSYDEFQCKDVPFNGFVDIAPYFGGGMPPNPISGAGIGVFKQNVQNIQTFVLSKPLQRFQPKFAQ